MSERIIRFLGDTRFPPTFFTDGYREPSSEPNLCNEIFLSKKILPCTLMQIESVKHKKRRNQTDAYHKKIQKRWDKRSKKDPKFQIFSLSVGNFGGPIFRFNKSMVRCMP
jgi:hypothetical protein